jgi:hypothetical protein
LKSTRNPQSNDFGYTTTAKTWNPQQKDRDQQIITRQKDLKALTESNNSRYDTQDVDASDGDASDGDASDGDAYKANNANIGDIFQKAPKRRDLLPGINTKYKPP